MARRRWSSTDDHVVTLITSTVTLANGLELAYAANGHDSSAVVVMLPGPNRLVAFLWPGARVVPDLDRRDRRHAARPRLDSDKPATGYRVEDFAADVVSFLDALDIERAVVDRPLADRV